MPTNKLKIWPKELEQKHSFHDIKGKSNNGRKYQDLI